MNLLHEPWLPVRRRDGSREWIAPDRLSGPNIVAFDAARPDFNGTLAQFAIGLLQTTTPMDSPIVWKQLFANPPDAATLETWFAPVAAAFEFDGEGARFMQDRSLKPVDGNMKEIDVLLIESPGAKTQKDNGDHFIKRGQVLAACPHCAASALLALQINAPKGGAGNRTGLRGGGPLTTLIVSQQQQSLWQDLWLNVRERSVFLAQGGDSTKTAEHFTFPWLADIGRIQKEGGETAPIQVHPAHVYWAMPRRIRLDFENVSVGNCAICGRSSERLVRQYVAKNYGLNYKGAWDHPLSPYYETKEGWLPLHPQPGGFGYRHWLAWVLGLSSDNRKQRPARVVEHFFLEHRRRQAGGQLRLWAFGYDIDDMKARCWYESSLPLYGLADCDPDAQRRVESEVGMWLAGAEKSAFYLTEAVRRAWFSDDGFDKWKEDKKRNFRTNLEASFWSQTESYFYSQLKQLIEAIRNDQSLDIASVRNKWHHWLIRTALRLFDKDIVGATQIERQNTRRAAAAYHYLTTSLGGGEILVALGLAAASVVAKPKSKRRSATAAA